MNTIKLNSLVNIMELCDIQTIYQMKFINKRNFKFSILRSDYLRLTRNLLDKAKLIEFEDSIFPFFYKNGIIEISHIKLIYSYIIVRKLKIIKKFSEEEKKYEKLVLSNFYKDDKGTNSEELKQSYKMIDRCFLYNNENFELHYKINMSKAVLHKSEIDFIDIINFVGKINKLKYEEAQDKITSLNLDQKNTLLKHSLEFLENNFDLQLLKIKKLISRGFPFIQNDYEYFKTLNHFISKNKNIFALNKISLKCQFTESSFFSNFKTEEFYILITNFFQDLFNCFSKVYLNKPENILVVNFLNFQFSYSLFELYFYIFCLSQNKENCQLLNYIKIKHLCSKVTIFKHLNKENYKKFLKEFFEVKNFSQYKYHNDEHLIKKFSRANLNNFKITGDFSKKIIERSYQDYSSCPDRQSGNNKLDLLLKDTEGIQEMDLEEEYKSNNQRERDSNNSLTSNNGVYSSFSSEISQMENTCFSFKDHSLDDSNSNENEKIRDEILSNKGDFKFNKSALEKENDTNIEKFEYNHDFNEDLLFEKDNKNVNSHFKGISENKYTKKNDKFKNYENEFNQEPEINLNNDESESINKLTCNQDNFNTENRFINKYIQIQNDSKNEINSPNQKNLKNIEYFEIKNYSMIFENFFFKIKNSLKTKNGLITFTKPFRNQINMHNLLNIDLRFDNKVTDFGIKNNKKFLSAFPDCLKSIKFDFYKFDEDLVSEILENIVSNGLKKIKSFNISFDYFNLLDSKCMINDKIMIIHDQQKKIKDNEQMISVDIDKLNEYFIEIFNNNKDLIKFNFTCENYILEFDKKHRSEKNKKEHQRPCLRFSKIFLGSNIKIDLIFASKILIEFLENFIIGRKPYIDIRLQLSAINYQQVIQINKSLGKKYEDSIKFHESKKEKNVFPYETIGSEVKNDYLSNSVKINVNEINRLNFLEFFSYFYDNSKIHHDNNNIKGKININQRIKGLKFYNFDKEILKILLLSKVSRKFFASLQSIEKLSLIYDTGINLDNEDSENYSLNFNETEFDDDISYDVNECLNKYLAPQDFFDFILLFSEQGHENTSYLNLVSEHNKKNYFPIHQFDLIESKFSGISNFKMIKELKIKMIETIDNGFTEAFLEFMIKNSIVGLNKLTIDANISDNSLENFFEMLIANHEEFNDLIYFLIKSKLNSGFSDLYDKYQLKIYNIFKSLIKFEFIKIFF